MRRSAIVIGVCVTLACACAAGGKIIYVDDDAPPGGDGKSWVTAYRYLQDALADARAADRPVEVRVAQGVYKPDQGANQKPRDRLASFHLFSRVGLKGGYAGIGTPDPNARDVKVYQTILSGDLAGNDAKVDDPCDLKADTTRIENSFKVVVIYQASDVRLDGLTIAGGYWDVWEHGRIDVVLPLSGAGVFAEQNGDLILKDCRISSNYSAWGSGGCRFGNCTAVQMQDCNIEGNANGGVSLSSVTATISRCVIGRNCNGGIHFSIGSLLLTDSIVRTNTSFGCALGVGEVSFERCIIERNSAESRSGGGIASESGTHRFNDCHFYNNGASVFGGAISVGFSSSVDLHGCVFAGNRSAKGGAIHGSGFGKLNIVNCTFSANRATHGSSILCQSTRRKGIGGVTIVNSIIDADDSNTITTDDARVFLDYTLLSGGIGSIIDPNNNVIWGRGNMSGDPCFADAGYWDASGGAEDPNEHFFIVGDFHLRSQGGRWNPNDQSWVMDGVTSPCIDAGDLNSPVGQEPFPNGGRINMGTYGGTPEASKSYFGAAACETIIAGDINGDCRVDWRDLAILARHWLEMSE